MRVKVQKKMEFVNECDCIVDYSELELAMIWYSGGPLARLKRIFMYGKYPGVAIYKDKIHVHRLLYQYWNKKRLSFNDHVHHINGDKLDASKSNLTVINASEHLSLHNSGKTLSADHRAKIAAKNKLRKGIRFKDKRSDVSDVEVYNLKLSGLSINAIAIHFKMDWSSIKSRFKRFIHDHPHLLNPAKGAVTNTMNNANLNDPGTQQATEEQVAAVESEAQENAMESAEEGTTEG